VAPYCGVCGLDGKMKYKVVNPNKYSGCFLGLAIGDALGAPFEGGFI